MNDIKQRVEAVLKLEIFHKDWFSSFEKIYRKTTNPQYGCRELVAEVHNLGFDTSDQAKIAAFIAQAPEMALIIKELTLREEKLVNDVQTLWMLLDDIDTLDDAAKDDDSGFRKACYKIQQKRWEIKDPFNMAEATLTDLGINPTNGDV